MYQIKIFIKTSVKKLKKIFYLKNKNLLLFIKSIDQENNKNLSIISKKLKVFIQNIQKLVSSNETLNTLLDNIYIYNIILSPSKKLKRVNFRAKGKTDIIEKRNSFITIVLSYKKISVNKNFDFTKKNYLIKNIDK